MDFIDKKISDYAVAHSQQESETLRKIDRETHIKMIMPRMLSGVLQADFLGMMARVSKATCILEVGTFTAYASIAMAEFTPSTTQIHTLEINPEFESTILKNIESAGFSDRIQLHLGPAEKSLESLEITPDFVFVDADKINYALYYDLILPKLPAGAIMLVDNVLWSGKVLLNPDKQDKDTKAIHQFNEKVQADDSVINVLLPIRDGIMMIIKK